MHLQVHNASSLPSKANQVQKAALNDTLALDIGPRFIVKAT